MTAKPVLNLLVIRTGNFERSLPFYAALGIDLMLEQHGSGPQHYSADFGGLAFEIYPLGNAPITIATRLGFRVPQSMPP